MIPEHVSQITVAATSGEHTILATVSGLVHAEEQQGSNSKLTGIIIGVVLGTLFLIIGSLFLFLAFSTGRASDKYKRKQSQNRQENIPMETFVFRTPQQVALLKANQSAPSSPTKSLTHQPSDLSAYTTETLDISRAKALVLADEKAELEGKRGFAV